MVESVDLVAIDSHFGEFVSRLSGGSSNVFLAAALTSAATRGGHACLDLSVWATRSVVAVDGASFVCPELEPWLRELTADLAIGDAEELTPLVLENGRLYFRRYWEYENDIALFVRERGRHPSPGMVGDPFVESVERLFPGPAGTCDWQRLAALAVFLRSFVVITGGPGTGKTTTVARIIALLLEQQLPSENLRIALAAPTGKAVMRLQMAMAEVKKNLACSEEIKDLIPTKVITLHRLLGPRKDSPFFQHDEKNKLALDLVVIDEASMVDLPLMAKLMRALPFEAKVVLLGDRHQLASVEPGAVLGDICGPEAIVFSQDFLAKAALVTRVAGLAAQGKGVADSQVELQVSHRFGADSGIALLGQAINRGDARAATEVLAGDACPDVLWREVVTEEQLRQGLTERFGAHPPEWFGHGDPGMALRRLGSRQVLCAVRQGAFGVNGVNRCIEEALAGQWGVVPGSLSYPGRPVMVVNNNYELQLFNGDTGIVLADPGQNGALQAFFPTGDGNPRKIPMAMLPAHETAYAMTVHKSQGSEFDEVVVILPDWQSAVLSRELLYTALTRARKRVEIWGKGDVFKAAVRAEITRHGGLQDKLRLI